MKLEFIENNNLGARLTIGEKPISNKSFLVRNGRHIEGSTDLIPFDTNFYYASSYGVGAERTTLQNAIDDISWKPAMLIIDGNCRWDLDGDHITFPKNIQVIFGQGSYFSWTDAETKTIENFCPQGIKLYFDCPLTNTPILGGIEEIYPEYFANILYVDTYDSVPAIQRAVNTGIPVKNVAGKNYYLLTYEIYANRGGQIFFKNTLPRTGWDLNGSTIYCNTPSYAPNMVEVIGTYTSATTLTIAANKNQKKINVASVTGLVAGDEIAIRSTNFNSPNIEIHRIYSIAALEITLYDYLCDSYSSSSPVIKLSYTKDIEIKNGIIDGNGKGNDCINITTGKNIKITDMTCRNNNAGRGIIAETYSTNIELYNNTILDTVDNGIEYYSSVTNSRIIECNVSRSGQDGIKIHGNVNIIINCISKNNYRHGISLNDTKNSVTSGCASFGNGEHGLAILDANGLSFASISDNDLFGNIGSGIRSSYGGTLNINGNSIHSNYLHGIELDDATRAIISENSINYNAGNGIYFVGTSYSTIESNILRQNTLYGLVLTSIIKIYQHDNQFIDNGSGDISGDPTPSRFIGVEISSNKSNPEALIFGGRFADDGESIILKFGMHEYIKKFGMFVTRFGTYARGFWHFCCNGEENENTVTVNNKILSLTYYSIEAFKDIYMSIGKTLDIADNANGAIGSVVASGTSEVTVNCTAITTGSKVFFTLDTVGGTVGTPYVSSISDGVSFGVKSTQAGDTSTYTYLIVQTYTQATTTTTTVAP